MTTTENGLTVKRASAADLARVRFLARTLYDWAGHVKTSTGMIVARGALPGEAATNSRVCPACRGHGFRRVRGVAVPCERCEARGALAVDGYTGREVEGGDDSELPIDEQLRRHYADLNAKELEGERGTVRDQHRSKVDSLIAAGVEGGEDDQFTGAVSAKAKQWERGSYAELERVWFQMREREPRRFRDFGRFVVYRLPIRSARMEARVDRLVLLVAVRMAKPILPAHVPGMKTTRQRRRDLTATGERNAEIRRLAAEGWKQSRLAREFGISQGQVSKIVREEQAA